jgi:glycosyltransferase involved in cell wall biosynthesis
LSERLCGLIPVYNNPLTIKAVALQVRQFIDYLIIVDDGSDDETASILKQLSSDDPEHITVHPMLSNQGKGAAVQAGFKLAQAKHFTHALQVDADGQHTLTDIPRFIDAMKKSPEALILGDPIFDAGIPAIRKHGRKLTKAIVALETGALNLPDAMCGFRIYPLHPISKLSRQGSRMSFDPDVMVRAYWANIPFVVIPTRVRYLSAEEGGVSHFRMVHDNLLNIWTHTRLTLQAPLRWLLRWAKQ